MSHNFDTFKFPNFNEVRPLIYFVRYRNSNTEQAVLEKIIAIYEKKKKEYEANNIKNEEFEKKLKSMENFISCLTKIHENNIYDIDVGVRTSQRLMDLFYLIPDYAKGKVLSKDYLQPDFETVLTLANELSYLSTSIKEYEEKRAKEAALKEEAKQIAELAKLSNEGPKKLELAKKNLARVNEVLADLNKDNNPYLKYMKNAKGKFNKGNTIEDKGNTIEDVLKNLKKSLEEATSKYPFDLKKIEECNKDFTNDFDANYNFYIELYDISKGKVDNQAFTFPRDYGDMLKEYIDPVPRYLYGKDRFYLEAIGNLASLENITVNVPKVVGRKWTIEEFREANPNIIGESKKLAYEKGQLMWQSLAKQTGFLKSTRNILLEGHDHVRINASNVAISKMLNGGKKGITQGIIFKDFINGKKIEVGRTINIPGLKNLQATYGKGKFAAVANPILNELELTVQKDLEAFSKEHEEIAKKQEEALKAAMDTPPNYNKLTDYAIQVRQLELRVKDYHENILPRKMLVIDKRISFANEIRRILDNETSPKVKTEFLLMINNKYDTLDPDVQQDLYDINAKYNDISKKLVKKVYDTKDDLTIEEESRIYSDAEFKKLYDEFMRTQEEYFSKYFEAALYDKEFDFEIDKFFNQFIKELDETYKKEKAKNEEFQPDPKVFETPRYNKDIDKLIHGTDGIEKQIEKNKKFDDILNKQKQAFQNKFQERFKSVPDFKVMMDKSYGLVNENLRYIHELEKLRSEAKKLNTYAKNEGYREKQNEIREKITKINKELTKMENVAQALDNDLIRYGVEYEKFKTNPYFLNYPVDDKSKWPVDDKKGDIKELMLKEFKSIISDFATLNDLQQANIKKTVESIKKYEQEYTEYLSKIPAGSPGITEDFIRKHNQLQNAMIEYHIFKEKLSYEPVQTFSFSVSNFEDYSRELDLLVTQNKISDDLRKIYLEEENQLRVKLLAEINKILKPPIKIQVNISYPIDPANKQASKDSDKINIQSSDAFKINLADQLNNAIKTNAKILIDDYNAKSEKAIKKIENHHAKREKMLDDLYFKYIDKSTLEVTDKNLLGKQISKIFDSYTILPGNETIREQFKIFKSNPTLKSLQDLENYLNKVDIAETQTENIEKSPHNFGLDENSIKNMIEEQNLRRQFLMSFDKFTSKDYERMQTLRIEFLKNELKNWEDSYSKLNNLDKDLLNKNDKNFQNIVSNLQNYKSSLDSESISMDDVPKIFDELINYYIVSNTVNKNLKKPYDIKTEIARINQAAIDLKDKFEKADKAFLPIQNEHQAIRVKVKKLGDEIDEFNKKMTSFENDRMRFQNDLYNYGLISGGYASGRYLHKSDADKIFARWNMIGKNTIGTVPEISEIENIYKELEQLYLKIDVAYQKKDSNLLALCKEYEILQTKLKASNDKEFSDKAHKTSQAIDKLTANTNSWITWPGPKDDVRLSFANKAKLRIEFSIEHFLYNGDLDHKGRIEFVEKALQKIIPPTPAITSFLSKLQAQATQDKVNLTEEGKKLLIEHLDPECHIYY